MKKIIIAIFTVGATALTFQSCMKPADNSKAQASIDSLTNLKITGYRDSLTMICMNDVMTQAQARADSMMQASTKKGGSKSSTKKSTTVTTPSNPKADKMSGSTKTATEEKKDKMSEGSQQSATDKKKQKMKGDSIPPKK